MECIIMKNTLIKLTHHDETKKMAHNSQIVRAKDSAVVEVQEMFSLHGKPSN